MNALVGYTGFVGSNIYEAGHFDAVYNSKNIEQSYGTNPNLLIFAGLRAEKYLANNAPEKDMLNIYRAEDDIAKINPKKLVLISTIDVFKYPKNVDERSEIDTENLSAYGLNRYRLELWVRKTYPDALIIRLPALFGRRIKKNFIYDYLNLIPFMLNADKMEELSQKDSKLYEYYEHLDNGFYKVRSVYGTEKEKLKSIFRTLSFSALNFTDSRSRFQFYPLDRLWKDIQSCLKNDILLWHPATEPVSAGEIYKYLTGEEFVNELDVKPADYDYKTIFAAVFGGKNGYIEDKIQILKEIDAFVSHNQLPEEKI